MLDRPARIQAWLADLEAINHEIEANGLPIRQRTTKRARKLKPLWEE